MTVTATKRTESAQSIPVAVTALGEQELKSLGVKSFNDHLIQPPGAFAGARGPPEHDLHSRPRLHDAQLDSGGRCGPWFECQLTSMNSLPAQPGRIRTCTLLTSSVEVLSGPQGTLFGAGFRKPEPCG
ncbi:MAG: hypothetical protein R3B98_04600 [Hyphomonas sp.]